MRKFFSLWFLLFIFGMTVTVMLRPDIAGVYGAQVRNAYVAELAK